MLMAEIRTILTDGLIASGIRWDFSQPPAMIKRIFDFLDGGPSMPSSGHPDYHNNSPKKTFQISCPCERLPSFYRQALDNRAAV